jgi:hypothetical protein
MIPTLQIRTALLANLTASGRFEKVMAHSTTNLGEALEHLRDSPDSIAVVIPGEDKFEHTFEPGWNTPVRAEIRNTFELLISDRELDMRETGVDDSLTFKDQIVARLMWDDLSTPGLICLPVLVEPVIITTGDERNTKGREAWKITLEMRSTLHG